MYRAKAVWNRLWKTLFQSAVGSGVTAAISAIGTAHTIGEVKWGFVASTAAISALVSFLMNVKANLPELASQEIVFRDEDDRSDDAPIREEEE